MDEVQAYLSNTTVNAPFFFVVGDGDYANAKTRLLELGLHVVPVSECCAAADKPPSLDRLMGRFDFADIDGDSRDKRIAVTGLGEYLALCGADKAYKTLSDLKDKKIGNARVVLLLRGVSSLVRRLQAADPVRFTRERVCFAGESDSDIRVILIPPALDIPAENGIRALLRELENGRTEVRVRTNAAFEQALFSVRRLASAYDGVKQICPTFTPEESLGSEVRWTAFLAALTAANGELDAVIDLFGDRPEREVMRRTDGTTYENWLYFIALKLKSADIDRPYLKYVVETTHDFNDFKKNLVNAIRAVPHTDARFDGFYDERKALVEKLSESEIAAFVSENRRDVSESVYRLTDQTPVERREFIALLASIDRETLVARAETAYPALADYLRTYTFDDPHVGAERNALFTEYFDRYKWQKVLNALDGDFVKQVEALASRRVYNGLRTRAEILNTVDKTDAFLYWIDALGVEFLAFIRRLCERKGLSLRVHIARADLPSITSANKDFFDNWEGEREKEDRLDAVKHKESGGYVYRSGSHPTHLAEELDILGEALEKAAVKLARHACRRVLIASDHGASRLAVIREQEEKYEVDAETKGRHGGRCCKKPADFSPTAYDLPFATESADGEWLVLADYGRFRGSRAANVEVHGGASPEEVVIPVIELTLANAGAAVELLNPDGLFASFRKKLAFTLFSETERSAVSVVVSGRPAPYRAVKADEHRYHVVTDITRPGEYTADVLDGDNLIGKIRLRAQSETQKTRADDGFDDIL